MYRPDFNRDHKYRTLNLFTRFCPLRYDKHRIVWFHTWTGVLRTLQYPDLYPLTRNARDSEV